MKKKSSDTIRIDDTQRIDQTQRIDDTVRIDSQSDSGIDNTKRVVQPEVIKSGFGGGVALNAGSSNIYEFNGNEYRVITKITEATSEAQIFLVERDAEQFILKYYYPFVKPKLAVINRLKSLSHPDIIDVIDYGYYDDRFFEISVYADMGSLAEHIPVKGIDKIKRYVEEINNALKYCHDNGIIHRDIKPANIFLKDKNKNDILVGDFGIASIVSNGEELRRTTIFQTPIYAAPEFKLSLRGETLITKAVDYYALGITVWEMYSGQLPPNGMDELEFLREMFEGTPPLQPWMDETIVNLIKGLTLRNYKNRWGYNEVKKWLAGEKVDIAEDSGTSSTVSFDFGEDKNGNKLTAQNSKELAKLIYKYPDLGRKHLYRGTIKEWLKKVNQNLFVEIADITDYKYKNDEITGTKLAVYLLDKDFPYVSLNNQALRTKQQIVDELRINYKTYVEKLKNPNHDLYLFLLSKNADELVERLRNFYKTKEAERAFYYLLYTLEFSINKNAPFAIFNKGKLKVLIKTVEELADYFIKNPKSRKPLFLSADFFIWLEFKDRDLAHSIHKRYKEEKGATESFLAQLPYLLAPEAGYKGIKGNQIFNLCELGKEFYENFEEYRKLLQKKDCEVFNFLRANNYPGEVSFIQKCFSPEDKPTPHTKTFALVKIIKGFEYDLPYNHQGKQYFTPEELLNGVTDKSKLEEELSNQTSFLNNWLSVFYHEQPLSDDKKYYVYYREDFNEQLENYLQFIKTFLRKNDITVRNEEAKKKAEKIKSKFNGEAGGLYSRKVFFFSIPIIPGLLLLLYSYFTDSNPLPFNIFAVNKWYFLTIAGLVTGYLFKVMYDTNDMELSTGCVGGPILGLITAVVLYYICYFIIASPLLLLVALGAAYYFVFTTLNYYVNDYHDALIMQAGFISADEVDDLINLYTFKQIKSISVNNFDEVKDIKNVTRSARIKVWIYSFIPALILGAVLFLLVYYTPELNLQKLFENIL